MRNLDVLAKHVNQINIVYMFRIKIIAILILSITNIKTTMIHCMLHYITQPDGLQSLLPLV